VPKKLSARGISGSGVSESKRPSQSGRFRVRAGDRVPEGRRIASSPTLQKNLPPASGEIEEQGTTFARGRLLTVLRSRKFFSNQLIFTIKSQTCVFGANSALDAESPKRFPEAALFVCVHRFAQFGPLAACLGSGCGVWPDSVCYEILNFRLRLHGTCS
jgi:hypothetical protein